MKTQIMLNLLVVVLLSSNFSKADQYNECDQGFITAIGRDTLWYEYRWDYWEVVYYPEGWIYAWGTGPVTLTPYSDTFSSTEFTLQGNKIIAFIDETYTLPGIWTLHGTGTLWRDLGGTPSFPNPGIVNDDCTGAF